MTTALGGTHAGAADRSDAPHGRRELAWQLALVFLLLYGYELLQFTFSVDEEFFSFRETAWEAWLSNARWGMAWICALLPPIWAMPVLPTALFGAGLVVAAIEMSRLFELRAERAFAFGALFVAAPVWPHVVEFSTLSYGVGVGVSALACGVRWAFRPGARAFVGAILLLAFSIATYQSFVLLAGATIVAVAVQRGLRGGPSSARSAVVAIVRGGGALGLALATYAAVQSLAMRWFAVGIDYVDDYLRLGAGGTPFEVALERGSERAAKLFAGADPIYLDWGPAVLALPLLGALVALRRTFTPAVDGKTRWLLGALVGATALVLFAPFVVAAGELPVRSAVWLPLLWAAPGCLPAARPSLRAPAHCLLALYVLAGAYISNQLFYTDELARQQDLVTATQLVQRIERLRTQQDGQLPFTVVGALTSSPPVRRVEAFGASFFEWDGGNVYRVNDYLRVLGVHDLSPHTLSEVPPAVLEQSSAMPSWPMEGSVAWLEGVIVVKLGPLTSDQIYYLCEAAPESSVCQ